MLIEGPLTERETTLTVANILQVRNWSLNYLSFELPHNIMASMDSFYFPQCAIAHISWGLTETGTFSVKSCFAALRNEFDWQCRLFLDLENAPPT